MHRMKAVETGRNSNLAVICEMYDNEDIIIVELVFPDVSAKAVKR